MSIVANVQSLGLFFSRVFSASEMHCCESAVKYVFGLAEPLVRTSSIPSVEAPPPPKKTVPKVPETRPTLETDDHKARNKDGLHSGQ